MLRKDVKKVSPTTIGTTDPTEIARFDALAEEWWNPDGTFKNGPRLYRVRVGHISERLPVLLQRDPRAARPLAGCCGAGSSKLFLLTPPSS